MESATTEGSHYNNRFEYIKENDHHKVDGDSLSKVSGNERLKAGQRINIEAGQNHGIVYSKFR